MRRRRRWHFHSSSIGGLGISSEWWWLLGNRSGRGSFRRRCGWFGHGTNQIIATTRVVCSSSSSIGVSSVRRGRQFAPRNAHRSFFFFGGLARNATASSRSSAAGFALLRNATAIFQVNRRLASLRTADRTDFLVVAVVVLKGFVEAVVVVVIVAIVLDGPLLTIGSGLLENGLQKLRLFGTVLTIGFAFLGRRHLREDVYSSLALVGSCYCW